MGIPYQKNTNLFQFGLTLLSLLVVLATYGSDPSSIKVRSADSVRVKLATASVNSTTDFSDFNVHEHAYFTEFDIDQVWCRYVSIKPKLLWSGPINHLKLLYNEKNGFNVHHITENTTILLELHFIKKIKVDALFLVTKIDPENHVIEFCYADNNITSGLQRIKFESAAGGTAIEHTTYYKSRKTFRDKMLYPYFHKQCIDEFHHRILTSLLKKQIQKSEEVQEIMVYHQLEH